MTLYEVNTEDFNPDDLIFSEILYQKNYVMDVEHTKECWITKEFTCTGRKITVTNWEMNGFFFAKEERRELVYNALSSVLSNFTYLRPALD